MSISFYFLAETEKKILKIIKSSEREEFYSVAGIEFLIKFDSNKFA